MKKYLLSILISFLMPYLAHAAIGEWQIHMAYHNATKALPAGNLIYTLSDGSLYSYNTEDTSLQIYNKTNLLNDVEIKDIAYIQSYNTLLIVYKSSNIDLLINDNEIFNIPDLMNKSMTEDKTINNIYINKEYAYLSTNFGIMIVNIKKKEITNTYILNKKVYNTVLVNQTLYLATDEGIYQGHTSSNLLDKKNWTLYKKDLFQNLFYFDQHLIGMTSDAVYIQNNEDGLFHKTIEGNFSYFSIHDNQLLIGESQKVILYKNNLEQRKTIETDPTNYLIADKDTYWAGNGDKGLNAFKLNQETNRFETILSGIIPNSPLVNKDFYMTYTDRLFITAGGIWKDRFFLPGIIMLYKDNTWSATQYGSDITKMIQHPDNPEHWFASTGVEGMYEFKDYAFIQKYTYNNSGLESIYPGQDIQQYYVRTNGVNFDKNKNLWITNAQVKNTLKVLKNNGEWISFYHKNFTNIATPGDILFDQRGWVWCSARRSGTQPGIFCFNTNNTLEDTQDDNTVFWHTLTDQHGNSISLNFVYTVQEDLDGTMWIGTDKGPLVLSNPGKIFESNSCTRIIVPRNDGTNLGDYLLENEAIKVICIDGDNRKWIGTENSGVYLISADGMETIHHFNTENSPLLSNNIESMAINPTTGEVFIGTDKGLVSFTSDATTGMNSFNDNNVYAYPNPVPSYYEGVIAIKGLMRDSQVKIVDVSGKLIYAGRSTGGQFIWDGKQRNGKRVPSGVYLVLATDENGKEGVATKIVMIK